MYTGIQEKIFQKRDLLVQNREEEWIRTEDVLTFMKLTKEDEEEEDVLAAVCHSGYSYSSIPVNREDDGFYKQLN